MLETGSDVARFHEGTEIITEDMTNTAFYTFGSGAGDQQQDMDKDSGAGDDQQVPDNQQDGEDKDTDTGAGDDTQDDAQDNQQGEMPEELPESGAGGLAPGAAITLGNAVAGLMMLVGAGYVVLRRR